ncbi:MAG: hypothetical protein JO193_01140 [Candidatus Eremiobacteraeota bacterium]|nr:hypothetical protein [Candidatus Eremiobacteraeota bacterium]
MKIFVKGLLIVAVVALFLLAVAASTQSITVRLPQSVLLLAIALVGVRVFRDNRETQLTIAVGLLIAGAVLHPWPQPLVQALSDALFALAITVVAVYIIGPPVVRLGRRIRGEWARARQTLASPAPDFSGGEPLPLAHPMSRRAWMPFIVAAILLLILAAIGGRALTGLESASLQWNAHVLTTSVARHGAHLSDPSIVVGGGSNAYVAVPDSFFLSLLKLIVPVAWAPFFTNLITLTSFGLFIYAGIVFLRWLTLGWVECVIATTLFVLLPIGLQPRFAAPFDLSLALLVIVPALSGTAKPLTFLTSSFAVGLCNTANGYELAALIAALGGFRLLRAPRSNTLVALGAGVGVVGSIVGGMLVKALAPSSSLREAWWFTQEIPRIVWAERLPVWWPAILLFILLAFCGFYAMARARLFSVLGASVVLAAGGALLALPTQLGGIPLVSPARVLQLIAPFGWPTARLLEVAAFALTVPLAYAASLLFASAARKPRFAATVVWVGALIVLALCLPRSPTTAIPNEAVNSGVVQFPIAEGGSRAGVMYAEDFFAAKARMLQPLIFVDTPAPLDLTAAPEAPSAVAAMRNAGVRFVLLRSDVYAKPEWRTVEPRLFSPAFSAQPAIDATYPWKFITYTPAGTGS